MHDLVKSEKEKKNEITDYLTNGNIPNQETVPSIPTHKDLLKRMIEKRVYMMDRLRRTGTNPTGFVSVDDLLEIYKNSRGRSCITLCQS